MSNICNLWNQNEKKRKAHKRTMCPNVCNIEDQIKKNKVKESK